MNAASQISDQIAHPHAQGSGQPHQRVNADGLLSPLDLPNINRVQIGYFSQPLLGESRMLAVLADGFPDKLSLSWRCGHAALAKQEGFLLNTVYSPSFFCLRL